MAPIFFLESSHIYIKVWSSGQSCSGHWDDYDKNNNMDRNKPSMISGQERIKYVIFKVKPNPLWNLYLGI